MCDRPLGEPFDDVESELIGFRIEKGPEERRPPSEDKPRVSQHVVFVFVYRLLSLSVTTYNRTFYFVRSTGIWKTL